jgi:uncharacterized repeat protein (TIGR01451 family)
VFPGDNITYSVVFQNQGTAAAVNATMVNQVPAGTTFVSAVQISGPAFTLNTPAVGSTGNVTATIGSFAVNASATFQIVFRVTP